MIMGRGYSYGLMDGSILVGPRVEFFDFGREKKGVI